MDTRSIDVAKTATIDLPSLNNKVVKMRPIVKRTKVQIVNKLSRHITALKKKKGTDVQKERNIRKAERLVEEIESIRRLREDKISKYSLANMSTFESVSESTLSPNIRALARLADHHLLKSTVNEFRQEHADWRDLSAFLLVKQTGRKFKTKKQKQKKLTRRVENINASEAMTKAYIQERFGQEGLELAEKKFQMKRKKGKGKREDSLKVKAQNDLSPAMNDGEFDLVAKLEDRSEVIQPEESENVERLTQNSPNVSSKKESDQTRDEDQIQESADGEPVAASNDSRLEQNPTNSRTRERLKEKDEASMDENDEDVSDDEPDRLKLEAVWNSSRQESSDEDSHKVDEGESNEMSEEEKDDRKSEDEELEEKSEGEEEDGMSDSSHKGKGVKEAERNKAETSNSDDRLDKNLQDECVVKELKIGMSDDEEEDSSNDDMDVSGDETSSEMENNSSSDSKKSESASDDDDDGLIKESLQKKRKVQDNSKTKNKKEETIPDFLTERSQVLKNTPKDPFFVESDGEEVDDESNMYYDEDDNFGYSERDSDYFGRNYENMREERETWSKKQKTMSTFYEPNSERSTGGRFERKGHSSDSRFGTRNRFEKRGFGRDYNQKRDESYRGRQSREGSVYFKRGKRIDGRGSHHESDDGTFRFGSGSSRGSGRGFSRGGDRNFSRGGDRNFSRGGDRSFSRGGDRSFSRGGDRGFTRGGDRGFTRGGDRNFSRGGDRSFSRGGDRSFSRGGDRGFSRGGDRSFSRGGDRGFSRGRDRSFSRGGDRSFTRDQNSTSKSQERSFGNMPSSSQRFGASSAQSTGAPASSAEKLHPSWEASRKRKAEQSGLKAFEGKKIVFDDD